MSKLIGNLRKNYKMNFEMLKVIRKLSTGSVNIVSLDFLSLFIFSTRKRTLLIGLQYGTN